MWRSGCSIRCRFIPFWGTPLVSLLWYSDSPMWRRYNTEGKDKDRDLRLVWYRQDPSVEGEAYQEIFKDQPSRSELQQGYVPWTERIHLNQFYQRIVEDKDMKISKDGRRITPLRKAAIRKSGPIEMADES